MARFKRAYPRSIYIRQGQSPPAITAYQPKPFIARNPVPQRGQAGPLARAAGAGRTGVQTSQGTAGPPRPFVFRSPAPARARVGPQANTCSSGVPSQSVTPQGSPSSPAPRPVIQHLPPHRAKVGPGTYLATGRPGVRTPLGFQSQPAPRPVIVHVPPARARLGLRGQAAGGVPSAVSTPLGSPSQPAPRPVIQHLPPRRAWVGGSFGPYGGIGAPAAPAAQAYRSKPFVFRSPAPARARLGTNLLCGDGYASPVSTPQGTPGPPRPFVFHSPPRARARLGNNLLPADGVASQISTPLGSPSSPPPRPVIQHLPAHRAVWRGNASRNITLQGVAGPPRPFVWRSPLRARARLGNNLGCGDGYPSSISTPQGAPSSPPPRPVIQHLPPRRAVWRGLASRIVTPSGILAPPRKVQTFPPKTTRARIGRSTVAGGIASSVVTPPFVTFATTYQRTAPQIKRPAPARALTGRGGCGSGIASRIVTPPLGAPSNPAPRPVIQHLPPHRVVWRGNAVPPPVVTAYQRKPFVFRSPLPARARLGNNLLPGDGVASRNITLQGAAGPARKIQIFPPKNTRARVGPATVAGGIASQTVTPSVTVTVPPFETSGPIYVTRPHGARARTGGIASQVVTPPPVVLGAPPYAVPVVLGQQARPARAVVRRITGPANPPPPTITPPRPLTRPVAAVLPAPTLHGRAATMGGLPVTAPPIPGAVVLQPLTRPVAAVLPAQRLAGRAAAMGTLAAPAATVTAATAYQRPGPQVKRPAPARARTGRGTVAGGIASQIVTPPTVIPLTVYQRPAPQVKRPAPARAVLGPRGQVAAGIASRVVTPLGSIPPARKVPIFPPKITRARIGRGTVAGGIASPIVTPLGALPALHRPLPPQAIRPAPHRALWRGFASTVVTPPPVPPVIVPQPTWTVAATTPLPSPSPPRCR